MISAGFIVNFLTCCTVSLRSRCCQCWWHENHALLLRRPINLPAVSCLAAHDLFAVANTDMPPEQQQKKNKLLTIELGNLLKTQLT